MVKPLLDVSFPSSSLCYICKMPPPKYSHERLCPLSDPSNELRVLEIFDNEHEPIEGKLVKSQREKKYSALSWCWGSREQDSECEIRIIQSSQSYAFPIPRNLESAIRALRNHKVFRVWIDYICMDQNNINEKNYQVPMMSTIYGESECVYVWLGDEDKDSKQAMRFIKDRVLNLRDFDRLIRDETPVKEWQALSALMKRPWFSRRWIVQEIAIAQRATILCGTEKMAWKDFADAISLFNKVETGTRKVSEVMKNDKELGHMPEFFGDVSQLNAAKLVEETNNLFRRLAGNERQAQFSLQYLVSKLITFDASEPRDTIYALLAIARDTVPVTSRLGGDAVRSWTWPDYIKEKLVKQLAKRNVSKPYHVNYELPLSDVYVQFVKWAIDKSDKIRALDIICRPWAPVPKSTFELSDEEEEERDVHWRIKTGTERPAGEGEDTLPSWIPTTARAAFGMDGTGQRMTRKNADSLVGLPPQRIYSAAGTRVLTENFRVENGTTRFSGDGELNGLHYHSMYVEGFILDKVKELKYPSQQGNIPNDWIRMAGRVDPSGDLPDEFWRTLVADRSPAGENAPRYYPRLVHHALKQRVPGDSLNTKDIVNWGNCTMVGEVLRRVQSAIWNRKLMRTEKIRCFGLVPQYTLPGDLICILYGCSVPVLLRKFTKSEEEVEEENRQRQKKQEEIELKRRKDAVLKIGQLWLDRRARRGTQPSSQATSPTRKRKRGSASTTPSRKKQSKANTTPENPGTTRTQNESSSAPGKTDKTPLRSDSYTYYQLIGECYVDGMMNGEALSRLEPSVLFEIR
ncbi:HET-domain-containing protein [Hypoxylon sp. FL0890]|nr:HET-domain-containing protein [Hypoxylon sp. FL0890]